MASELPDTFRQLRTLVTENGKLELSLAETPMPTPGDGDIVIRVEATPINPSDLGLLVGAADLSTLKNEGSKDSPKLVADIPGAGMRAMKARVGQSLGVGQQFGIGPTPPHRSVLTDFDQGLCIRSRRGDLVK